MRFVIITGLSGAGKSQTIKCLEDFGFFCIDNLPPALILKFAEICYKSDGKMNRVALVIDSRGGELFNELMPSLRNLKDETGFSYEILFLDASDNVIVKRFKESRRMHPLSQEGSIIDGITKERNLLKKVKNNADLIIDTSNLTIKQLKEQIIGIFFEHKQFKSIVINIMSFGFKYGLPIDSDLIFDVRFIPNPYYIESMKKLTGQDSKVKDYVLMCDETTIFLDKLLDMLVFLIPNYMKEGKLQLMIGIGCTGGRHRSVAITNELNKFLTSNNYYCITSHRDIEK